MAKPVKLDPFVLEVQAKLLLYQFGIEPTESVVEQFMVFMEALKVMADRNEKYKDLWKQYGANDNLMHMRSKLDRTMREFDDDALSGENFDPENFDFDDPIDLLNYTVFFIRNVRDGRVG